jgi:ribosomal protein S6--L-glutamate ligase
MKMAIISLGGRSSRAIAKYCKKYFKKVDELDIRDFEVHLKEDGEYHLGYKGEKIEGYDCIYVRGSYKYLLIQKAISNLYKKESYMPISEKAFSICHDKFLTLLELQKKKIPVPKTYYAPTLKAATKTLEKINYPIIIKVQSGTHGKGVMIAESKKSAIAMLDTLESLKRPYIIQEFVETEKNSDIRVLVFGNKVLACYKRVAKGEDFRSNVHAGGTRECHALTKEQEKIALNSARAIEADFCGIDILNSKNPSVVEVNLSPSLRGNDDASTKNILEEIAKIFYSNAKDFVERKEEKIKERIKKKEDKKSENCKTIKKIKKVAEKMIKLVEGVSPEEEKKCLT